MAVREIGAEEAGLPAYDVPESDVHADARVFNLSSHARARDALDFGLRARDPGFNIFVLGEDRSGRMTATLAYLEAALAGGKRPDDWIYLNNFKRANEPLAIRLSAGEGRKFRDAMTEMVPHLRRALHAAFGRSEY